jgi:hypothetical protein
MSITVNKGVPQLDARQTTSLHPLHHLAMRHHIILFRSPWPSGGGAHEQRERERQQDPRRCVDEGQEYAPHVLLEAQKGPAILVWTSKPRQRVVTNFDQELLLREEMDSVGLSLARPLSQSAVLAKFRDLP